jgi:transketolase
MNGPYNYLRPEVIEHLRQGTLLTAAPGEPTRHAYAAAVLELGHHNPDVVVLNADVAKSIGTNEFAKAFPEREFNFGIAEQNMVAAAAGMATTGLIPYATSYAVFLTMRALDQVRNSIHYPRLNVKIASSHGGITPGPDGPTHQGQEDLSLMRAIANATIVAAADSLTTRRATWAAAEWEGPVYLSFTRDPVPFLYTEDVPFEIGKAIVVREGRDATVVAIRDMVAQALVAAQLAEARGLSVRVIDCHTLKPLDEALLLQAARETGAIVTAESNTILGGLGSAVAELLVEQHPIPMQRIGLRDTFAESGPYLALLDKYGMSAHDIAQAVAGVVARKLS